MYGDEGVIICLRSYNHNPIPLKNFCKTDSQLWLLKHVPPLPLYIPFDVTGEHLQYAHLIKCDTDIDLYQATNSGLTYDTNVSDCRQQTTHLNEPTCESTFWKWECKKKNHLYT